jgi:L-lactate dehydrogenase
MIVQSIGEDLRYTMPVSVLIDDYCGVSDVCLSVPCVIGRQGVHMRMRPKLSDHEQDLFRTCATRVRSVIDLTTPYVRPPTS